MLYQFCIFRFMTSYFAHKNINKYEVVSRCECVQLWWSQVRWRYPPATPGQAPKIPVRVAEKSSPSPAVHSSPATHGPGPGPGDGGERADSDTAGCPQGPGPRRVRRRVGGTGESGPARLRERWTRRHHCRPRAGRGQSWAKPRRGAWRTAVGRRQRPCRRPPRHTPTRRRERLQP